LTKRIAVLHSDYIVRGGAERKSLLYTHFLTQKGFQVTIFCGNFNEDNTFHEYLYHTNIKSHPYKNRFQKGLSWLKIIWKVRRYDLIIANNHPSQLTAGIVSVFFKKPVIWFCNETLLYIGKYTHPSLKIKLLRRIEQWAVKPFSQIIANSQNTAGQIRTHLGLHSKVIYSGLDLALYPKKYTPRQNALLQLICISRIEKHKDLDKLYELANALKQSDIDYQLQIIGTGTYLEELKAKNPFPNQISFLMNLSETKKIHCLCKADLFIFPTRHEPLGVTPIEAMACGVPVLAFNSGGVKETVIHGKTGYLVGSITEMTEKVKQLSCEPELRKDIGKCGMSHIHKHFTVKQMCDDLVKVIISL